MQCRASSFPIWTILICFVIPSERAMHLNGMNNSLWTTIVLIWHTTHRKINQFHCHRLLNYWRDSNKLKTDSPFCGECGRYEATRYLRKGRYILLWWKSNCHLYPSLEQYLGISKYVLEIPASSATSKRMFSAGGLTITKGRQEYIEDLLSIRLNFGEG